MSPDKERQILEITYVVFGSLTTILNCLEIIFLVRRSVGFKPYEKILLSLAVSDLLVAVATTIFKVFDSINFFELKWLNEGFFSVILVLSSSCSTCNLFVLTVDRFLVVKYPLKHHVYATSSRMSSVIVTIWVLNFGLLSVLAYELSKGNLSEEFLIYPTAIVILFFGVGMVIVYLYIARRSCISGRMSTNSTAGPAKPATVRLFFSQQYRKERHIFYTCCLVAITYMLCSYPFAIEYLIRRDAEAITYISRFALFSNSFFNPLVYFFKGYLDRKRRQRPQDIVPMSSITPR